MTKWAKNIERERNRLNERNGEPRPRYFVVMKQNLHEPWVQEAIARGDQVTVMNIPWYVRLWWRIKRIFGRGSNGKDRQAEQALGAKDPRRLQGSGPDRAEGGGEDGDDLF